MKRISLCLFLLTSLAQASPVQRVTFQRKGYASTLLQQLKDSGKAISIEMSCSDEAPCRLSWVEDSGNQALPALDDRKSTEDGLKAEAQQILQRIRAGTQTNADLVRAVEIILTILARMDQGG